MIVSKVFEAPISVPMVIQKHMHMYLL